MTIENTESKDNKRKFILEKEIEKNKKILEKEMITKEEYEKLKNKILKKMDNKKD